MVASYSIDVVWLERVMSLVWIPLFFLAGTAGAFPTNGVDEAQADVSTNTTVQLWLVKPAAAAVDLVARPWQEAGSPSATIQLSSVQQPNAESESVDAITEPTVGSTVTGKKDISNAMASFH